MSSALLAHTSPDQVLKPPVNARFARSVLTVRSKWPVKRDRLVLALSLQCVAKDSPATTALRSACFAQLVHTASSICLMLPLEALVIAKFAQVVIFVPQLE